MNEYYDIVASTPANNLPHDTAQAEIARLPTYLTVKKTSPDGTQRIVTDGTELGDNTELVYVEKDTTNMITAIKSFVSGAWARWKIGTDDIDPDALDVMLDIESSKLTVELDETLPLRAAVYGETKREIYAKPLVNSTNIAYTADDEPIMEVPTNAQIDTPYIANQLVFNPEGVFAGYPNCEIRIGSNTGATSAEYEDGYSHGWIGSWNGIPIDIYITKAGYTSIFKFSEDGLDITVNGQHYLLGPDSFDVTREGNTFTTQFDADGNVLYETSGGSAQNFQWKNTRVGGDSVAMFLEAAEGKLIVNKLNIGNISQVADLATLAVGDIYAETDGTLKVVT